MAFLSKSLCCGILCWMFCTLPLFAEGEEGDSVVNEKVNLHEVRVRGHRFVGKVSTATPVQSIDKEQMAKLGLQNMADAVRRFAGAQVRDYGGIGGLKTVSVRNIGASHTAVSYDGVAVSNCQAGQIDIGRFSLNNVGMLSLSVGQSDDLLQSARLQQAAALLSVGTDEAFLKNDRKQAFGALLRGGSFGYGEGCLQYGVRVNRKTQVWALGEYSRADGNYPYELVNGKETTTEKRVNSHVSTARGELNLAHLFADSSRLRMKGYYYYSDRGLPGGVILYNNVSNERLYDENFFVQADYRKDFSDRWMLRAQAKYNHSWNRYMDVGEKYAGGRQLDVHRQDEEYAQATLLYKPSNLLTFSLAQDAALNSLRNNFPDCQYPKRITLLTALNARFRSSWLTVTGTLFNTYVSEKVDMGTAPDDRKRLSPSFSFSVKPFENHTLFLRAMYKNSYRVPSFNELYYRRLGNVDLRPERARELNVGVTWSGVPFDCMSGVSLTVDGYCNRVTDKIVAFPSTYVWKMANFGRVDITGLDVTLGAGFLLAHDVNLQLSGAFTWQRAIDKTDESAKYYDTQIPYTPEVSGNGSLLLETPWGNIGYTLMAVGERYSMSQHLAQYRLPSFVEHTVSLSKEFSFDGCRLNLSGEAVNFTDEQYSIIQYYPMPGRSYRITLSVQF